MSDRSSVPNRILGAVGTRLGLSDSLENINTTTLDDGAFCYVTSAHLHFELHRDSTASPDGVTIIAPIAGPGRWVEATGVPGAQGSQGFQGATGLQGAQGSQGSQGSQGPQGVQVSVARISTGNTGGTKLVDVATSTLVNGSLATVASVGSIFQLVSAAPAALLASVDGITVVQSTATPASVWVRQAGVTNPSFAATPPLFIDPTLGNDDNDGLASGVNALKSADEWCRRMDGQQIVTAITVNCAPGDVGNFSPLTMGEDNPSVSQFVQFLGSYTNSAEIGTISSITAQNPATGQEFIFSDTSGVGPTIPDNSRLMIVGSTTPANIGGTAYVKGFGGGGATNPYTTGWTTNAGSPFFPVAGDTYAVSTPTTIARSFVASWINKFAPGPTVGGFFWQNFLIETGRFAAYLLTSNELPGNGNFSSAFLQCVFNDSLSTNFARCNFRSYGCEFKVTVGVILGAVEFHSPCFRAGLAVNTSIVNLDAGPACFDGPSSSINLSAEGYVANSTDMCFSRGIAGPTPAILVQIGGRLLVTGQAWTPPQGSRNALSYGLAIYADASVNTSFFSLVNGLIGSIYNVVSDGVGTPSQITQFTVIENNQSAVTETSLGNGAIMALKELVTAQGGTIPAVSPTSGSERYSVNGGQFGRSAGGALSTLVPISALATKTHAQFDTYKVAGATVTTVGTATSTLLQVSTAAPGISGSADNCGFYVEAVFVGYDATNGNAVSGKLSRTFKRVAGTLTALGAQAIISVVAGDPALVGSTVALDATGIAIRMQATGVAGVTINWNACSEIWSTEFVG